MHGLLSLHRFWIFFVAALLLPIAGMALHSDFISLETRTEGSEIVLTWEVSNAAWSASDFEIRRRYMDKGSGFQILSTNRIETLGNGRFSYRDRDLFKDYSNDQVSQADGVIYQLFIVKQNGSKELLRQTEPLQYTTNAARSTWGNIKSMFQ